jgi:small subunit ribosomal protein S21
MSIRLRVHDREPIGQALRRFKRLIAQHGSFWEVRRRAWRFAPATQLRRRKRFRKRFKACQATLLAQKAGEQPLTSTVEEATTAFWKRSGKP